jgi:hypothetical protein
VGVAMGRAATHINLAQAAIGPSALQESLSIGRHTHDQLFSWLLAETIVEQEQFDHVAGTTGGHKTPFTFLGSTHILGVGAVAATLVTTDQAGGASLLSNVQMHKLILFELAVVHGRRLGLVGTGFPLTGTQQGTQKQKKGEGKRPCLGETKRLDGNSSNGPALTSP